MLERLALAGGLLEFSFYISGYSEYNSLLARLRKSETSDPVTAEHHLFP